MSQNPANRVSQTRKKKKTCLKQENARLRIKIERQSAKLEVQSAKFEQTKLALKKKIDKLEREIVELKNKKDGTTAGDLMASLTKQRESTPKN